MSFHPSRFDTTASKPLPPLTSTSIGGLLPGHIGDPQRYPHVDLCSSSRFRIDSAVSFASSTEQPVPGRHHEVHGKFVYFFVPNRHQSARQQAQLFVALQQGRLRVLSRRHICDERNGEYLLIRLDMAQTDFDGKLPAVLL